MTSTPMLLESTSPRARVLRACPLLLLAAACGGLQEGPDLIPAPGYDCEIDIGPPPAGGSPPELSLRYDFGGSEDPTDDSRSVWFRPEIDLTLVDQGSSTPLIANTLYVLEVPNFTSPGIPAGGARSATLSNNSGLVATLQLPLTRGQNWSFPDFTAAFLPADDRPGFYRTYLIDVDGSEGFCVTFDVGSTTLDNTVGLLGLRLDPVGSAPDGPEARLLFDVTDLDGAVPAQPLGANLIALENLYVRPVGGSDTSVTTTTIASAEWSHGTQPPTASLQVLDPQTGSIQAVPLGALPAPTSSYPLPGAFVHLRNVPGSLQTAAVVLAADDAQGVTRRYELELEAQAP